MQHLQHIRAARNNHTNQIPSLWWPWLWPARGLWPIAVSPPRSRLWCGRFGCHRCWRRKCRRPPCVLRPRVRKSCRGRCGTSPRDFCEQRNGDATIPGKTYSSIAGSPKNTEWHRERQTWVCNREHRYMNIFWYFVRLINRRLIQAVSQTDTPM